MCLLAMRNSEGETCVCVLTERDSEGKLCVCCDGERVKMRHMCVVRWNDCYRTCNYRVTNTSKNE